MRLSYLRAANLLSPICESIRQGPDVLRICEKVSWFFLPKQEGQRLPPLPIHVSLSPAAIPVAALEPQVLTNPVDPAFQSGDFLAAQSVATVLR